MDTRWQKHQYLCHWAGYDSMALSWVDQAMWHQYAHLMVVYWKGKKRIEAVSRDRERKMKKKPEYDRKLALGSRRWADF
jgi:hypothetical protein